jgi:CubicO group peptidase (beta-lactamase class C family)
MNQQFISRRAVLSRLGAVGLVSLTSSLTACGGGSGTMSPMTETERQAQVKSQIDAVLAGDWTTGKPGLSVLVRLAGLELYKSSRGSADAVGTPINTSTAFEIASITKALTATVVMQLVEKQVLALTDPITRWLPMLPSDWSHIQIRHLLSHSSGIPEFFENKPPSELDGLTNAQLVQRLVNNPVLDFVPGTSSSYSNTNYVLLAEVAATATGQSFTELMRHGVFEPCGMYSSWLKGESPPVASVLALNQAVSPLTYGVDILAIGAFGLRSTVEDMARFLDSWRQGRLVGPDTMRQMTTVQSAELLNRPGKYYGFGWSLDGPITTPRVYEHTGRVAGYVGIVHVELSQSLQLIVLSNSGDAGASQIYKILPILQSYYPAI